MKHLRSLTVAFAASALALGVQATPGLAPITSAQAEKVDALVKLNGDSPGLNAAVAAAASTIAAFAKINACLAGYDANALNAYAAPGKSYPNNNYIGGPMPMSMMLKHNRSTCASVLRIHGWTMPSRNTLRFEVVYVAEDSGESVKTAHEVQRQAGGEWLFTR